MLSVIEISNSEFRVDIYDEYIKLFPKEEQREWSKIENTYKKGIEKFYKILLNNKIIGFFMLEKLENMPYYLDYFAIFNEYQNKGYGTKALKLLLKNIKDGMIAEIEEINSKNKETLKRFNFYKKLGFNKVDSLYLLYNVLYNPIIYLDNVYKDEIDKIFFEYYKINVGEEALKENCKIIK